MKCDFSIRTNETILKYIYNFSKSPKYIKLIRNHTHFLYKIIFYIRAIHKLHKEGRNILKFNNKKKVSSAQNNKKEGKLWEKRKSRKC
jgi:hypothetical protein